MEIFPSKRSERILVYLILIWRKPKKTRFALKFSQEIRTETCISNFNLKGGSGPQHLRLWGIFGGGICSALYIWGGGGCSALYTENLDLVGIFGGGGWICSVLYTWRGMCSVFFSWKEILFRSTDSSFCHMILWFYLLNQFVWPKMTYTEFTFITSFTAWFFEIFFITRNHGWRRCWARLYRQCF